MKKFLLVIFGVVFMAAAANAQQATLAQPVKVVVPFKIVQSYLTISTGTANELTGNTNAVNTSAGIFGVYVENVSSTANYYVCFNNSSCSASAGANLGASILKQPSGGNTNWKYFSVPTWETLYIVSDTVSQSAIILTYK